MVGLGNVSADEKKEIPVHNDMVQAITFHEQQEVFISDDEEDLGMDEEDVDLDMDEEDVDVSEEDVDLDMDEEDVDVSEEDVDMDEDEAEGSEVDEWEEDLDESEELIIITDEVKQEDVKKLVDIDEPEKSPLDENSCFNILEDFRCDNEIEKNPDEELPTYDDELAKYLVNVSTAETNTEEEELILSFTNGDGQRPYLPSWTIDEKGQLLDALQQFGLEDVVLIIAAVPTKSPNAVILALKTYLIVALRDFIIDGEQNFETWLQRLQYEKRSYADPSRTFATVAAGLLTHSHDDVVNIYKCYNFIADIYIGLIPKLPDPQTLTFMSKLLGGIMDLLNYDYKEFLADLNFHESNKETDQNKKLYPGALDPLNPLKLPEKLLLKKKGIGEEVSDHKLLKIKSLMNYFQK